MLCSILNGFFFTYFRVLLTKLHCLGKEERKVERKREEMGIRESGGRKSECIRQNLPG